jgi:FkbM family methyltransferase
VKKIIRQILAAYGSGTPYHPGKWRIVESVVECCGLGSLNAVQEVTRQGVRWRLNTQGLVERSVYYLGVYEIHETRWLKQQIEPDWVMLDVGANFGYYANLVAHLAGPHAAVYAFEPSSDMFQALTTNRELNRFEQLHPQHAAVADVAGSLQLELPPAGNQGLGRIRDHGDTADGKRYEEVQTLTLNEFAVEKKLARLDFIKIDVEGAEMRVLSGAEDVIRRFKPKMMIEINPPSLEDFGTSATELLQKIRDLGYVVYGLEGARLNPLVDASCIGDYVNAICLPEPEPETETETET